MRTDVLHAWRLARIDLKLLGRNTTALFTVMLMPLLFAWLYTSAVDGEMAGLPARTFVLTGLPGMMLAFAVFINLVNSFTARREELVLKRLRGGQSSAVAIFGGPGLASLIVYLFQVALVVVWLRGDDGAMPANPLMMLLAAVLGTAVFALLAAAFSGLTPNAEMAQILVLPVLLVAVVLAPLMTTLDMMPEPMRVIATFMPVTAVAEMMRTGYTGMDLFGAPGGPIGMAEQWLQALPSLGVLAVWVVIAAALARWLFRWDPRRG